MPVLFDFSFISYSYLIFCLRNPFTQIITTYLTHFNSQTYYIFISTQYTMFLFAKFFYLLLLPISETICNPYLLIFHIHTFSFYFLFDLSISYLKIFLYIVSLKSYFNLFLYLSIYIMLKMNHVNYFFIYANYLILHYCLSFSFDIFGNIFCPI